MADLQLLGLHHLTAISADAPGNHAFYTQTMGMRLVKKTVNQDDVSAYHLFYADGLATPGSDLTFFDWPAPPERRGTGSIVRTSLRVADTDSLQWWLARFQEKGVRHEEIGEKAGRISLDFQDPEGQRLRLVVDGGQGEAHPWDKSPVPAQHQIRGLGPVTLSVDRLEPTDRVLRELMSMRLIKTEGPLNIYEMGPGGAAAELHLLVEPQLGRAGQGAGGAHHVAFRTPDDEQYQAWLERLEEFGVRSSGPVDRYYFRSLYFREPGGTLFEIATDGPGFTADEPLDQLGVGLALPPFLEPRRKEIEGNLKPL